mmetsp:Transcript_44496/g.123148  ORF Transcript_44496/g.123148 Transcript_44496/m.123148 type:complete len:343 (+) Transcript_44496:589-1617(+)
MFPSASKEIDRHAHRHRVAASDWHHFALSRHRLVVHLRVVPTRVSVIFAGTDVRDPRHRHRSLLRRAGIAPASNVGLIAVRLLLSRPISCLSGVVKRPHHSRPWRFLGCIHLRRLAMPPRRSAHNVRSSAICVRRTKTRRVPEPVCMADLRRSGPRPAGSLGARATRMKVRLVTQLPAGPWRLAGRMRRDNANAGPVDRMPMTFTTCGSTISPWYFATDVNRGSVLDRGTVNGRPNGLATWCSGNNPSFNQIQCASGFASMVVVSLQHDGLSTPRRGCQRITSQQGSSTACTFGDGQRRLAGRRRHFARDVAAASLRVQHGFGADLEDQDTTRGDRVDLCLV